LTFLDRGYAGASIELISDAAGYSKGAAYSNFDSKEEIFLAVLERKLLRDLENMGPILRPNRSLEQVLGELGRYLAGNEEALSFTVVTVEFLGQACRNPETAHRCAQLYQAQRDAIGELLDKLRAMAGKKPLAEKAQASAALVALTLGFAAQRAIDRKAIGAKMWSRTLEAEIRRIVIDQP
jgi:AcrR family transcriptional regulator